MHITNVDSRVEELRIILDWFTSKTSLNLTLTITAVFAAKRV